MSMMRGPYKLKEGEVPITGYVKKTITYRMAYPAPKKKAAPKAKKKAPSARNVTVRKKKKVAPFDIDYGKNKGF